MYVMTKLGNGLIAKNFFKTYIMDFEDTQLITFGDIFNKALEIAKTGDKDRCQLFLKSYSEYISSENNINIDKAVDIVKSNLGYFAGYYDRETYDIINNMYNAVHPVFKSNPFNVTS